MVESREPPFFSPKSNPPRLAYNAAQTLVAKDGFRPGAGRLLSLVPFAEELGGVGLVALPSAVSCSAGIRTLTRIFHA